MASRVLIISTSREVAPQPTLPIGAAWVAQALHLAGFQVEFLDLCFQRDPLKAVDEAVKRFNPDGIGLSVRNLDNCDFLSPVSFLPPLKEITALLKSRSNARILLGGAGVSIMPLQVLEYLDLDHAVVGEGERAAVEFFGLEKLDGAAAIPGVVCRGGHGRKDAAPHFSTVSVMPRTQRWVNAKEYLKLEPVLPVQGKRGCANRCLYCTYNRIEGNRWRLRDPASVVDEISQGMRETGAREFEFVDSIFNEPEGYLETLLEEIVRRQLKATFRISSLSPKGLTAAQLRLMERAGITSMVVTPESASEVTLAALEKGYGERDVHRAAELLSSSGMRVLWCFLLGGPKEDEASLAKTIGFINSGIRKSDAAFMTTGIRLYPDTGLHQLAIREGVVNPSNPLLMPTFYFSPLITVQRAKEVLQKEVRDLSRCIFVSDTRSSSLNALRRIGTMLRLPGPFWQYAKYVNGIVPSSSPARRK